MASTRPRSDLRGLRTAFRILKGGRQRCDLFAVQSGKVGMQQRHRSVRGSQLRKQRFLARLQLVHLGLEFRSGEAIFDRVDDLPDTPRTRSSSRSADDRLARYSIRRRFISRVNSSRNSSKRSSTQQLLLKCVEDALLDFITSNGQANPAPHSPHFVSPENR